MAPCQESSEALVATRTLLGVHHPALCKYSNVCASEAQVQYCPQILRGARPLPHTHIHRGNCPAEARVPGLPPSSHVPSHGGLPVERGSASWWWCWEGIPTFTRSRDPAVSCTLAPRQVGALGQVGRVIDGVTRERAL